MYLEDLSPYINVKGEIEPNVYAVGWLDQNHDFPKGEVSQVILERILELCFNPVNPTRGWHQSPFVDHAPLGYAVEYKGKHMLLGSAEIRVLGKKGRIYAAPNLIYHYIKDCGYRPPDEFLEALEAWKDA